MKTNKTSKKSRRKIFITLAVTAALIAAGSVYARTALLDKKENNTTYTVFEETFNNIIEISGNIEAAYTQNLAANSSSNGTVAGTVEKLYVKQGDFVKKGQVLIQMDNLNESYALANIDYQIAQAKIQGAERQINVLEKQRAVYEKNLENRRISALYDGIVAVLTCSEGDIIMAGSTSMGTLIDRSYLKATVEVAETDAAKLQVGQKVSLTLPALPGRTIDARVDSFPAAGVIADRGATVVETVIRIDNPPDDLYTEYSFTGEIEVAPPSTYLLVQTQAIGREGNQAFAEVLKNGRPEKTSVLVEAYDKTYVRVLSGLAAGDVVKAQAAAAVQSGGRSSMPGVPGMPPSGPR